jgi:hypothetical protein
MESTPSRRSALLGLGVATAGLAMTGEAASAKPLAERLSLLPGGATALTSLTARLAQAPRRRDYRDLPMVLEDPMLWDHEAIDELLAYRGGLRQIWDNTEVSAAWMNGMHNTLNAQIWSFKHPDFLIVSATHGPAEPFVLDQAMWDKYQLAGGMGGFKTNSLLQSNPKAEADHDLQSPTGAYSGAADSIPHLMDRGVVFLACHLALWDLSGRLIAQGVNPDRLSHGEMVAELTNHLAAGVVLTPGMAATIPEFQQAGYHYIK